jgi:hypothetical protein
MTTSERWQGHAVIDRDGERIGRIADVYYDDDTHEPEWARVRSGLFGRRQAVIPLSSAEAEGDEVRVPFVWQVVDEAPKVESTTGLSHADQVRLTEFYGTTYSHLPSMSHHSDDDPGSQSAPPTTHDEE